MPKLNIKHTNELQWESLMELTIDKFDFFFKWNLFNVHNMLSFFCQPLATKLRYHKALKQQQANADSWCNWQQRQVIFCHKRRRFSDIDETAYQNGERGQRVVTDYVYLRLIGTTIGVPVNVYHAVPSNGGKYRN